MGLRNEVGLNLFYLVSLKMNKVKVGLKEILEKLVTYIRDRQCQCESFKALGS